MIKTACFLFFSSIFLLSCDSNYFKNKQFDKFCDFYENSIGKKYDIELIATSTRGDDQINFISLNFVCKRKLNIHQSRDLMIKLITGYLKMINSYKPLKKFLYKEEIQDSQLKIMILTKDIDTEIKFILFSGNTISYYKNSERILEFDLVKEETLKNAQRKILKAQ